MKYNPQDAKPPLIPAGVYDAEIKSVQDTADDGKPLTSAKGVEMVKVVFKIYTNDRDGIITAYFLNNSTNLWRYKQLAEALGYKERFEQGDFNAAEHLGDVVSVELKIKNSEQYGEQNEIAKYLRRTGGANKPKGVRAQAKPSTPKTDPMTADDIPF